MTVPSTVRAGAPAAARSRLVPAGQLGARRRNSVDRGRGRVEDRARRWRRPGPAGCPRPAPARRHPRRPRPGCRGSGRGSRRARSGCRRPARCRARASASRSATCPGVSSAATRMPGPLTVTARRAGERGKQLRTDRADVLGAGPQVGIGQLGTTAARAAARASVHAVTASAPESRRAWMSAISSSSSSSSRCASKMPACCGPACSASARYRSISRRTAASAAVDPLPLLHRSCPAGPRRSAGRQRVRLPAALRSGRHRADGDAG